MATTIETLLTNPTGSNTRQVAARYKTLDGYREDYLKLFQNVQKRKLFNISFLKEDKNFIVIISIPSSTTNLFYDVALKFLVNEDTNNILKTPVRLYCNSPSWVFTYGYVARKDDFLFNEFSMHMGEALDTPPTKTNPEMQNGFDKYVTLGLLYLTEGIGIRNFDDLVTYVPRIVKIDYSDNEFSVYRKMDIREKLLEKEKAENVMKKNKDAIKAAQDAARQALVEKNSSGKTRMSGRTGSVKRTKIKS